MFYDAERFAFASILEQNTALIRAELDALDALDAGAFSPWVERDLYAGDDWQVFMLFADASVGEFSAVAERNRRHCPATVELLSDLPGLLKAGFSKMLPGAHVRPHAGSQPHLLRCHLGLRVPENTGLRFGDDERPWREGRCLIFDDTRWHEAFNRADSERVVLLADFDRAVWDR